MGEPAAGSGKKSDVWEYYEKIKDAPKAKYKLCNPVCNVIPLAQLGLTPQVPTTLLWSISLVHSTHEAWNSSKLIIDIRHSPKNKQTNLNKN